MAFNIQYTFIATDRFSSTSDKVSRSVKKLNSRFKSLNDRLRRTADRMSSIGQSLSLKLTAPIIAVGVMAIKTAADLETMQVSFESMLKSGDKAKKLMKDLIEFTAKTPFQLEGVGAAAKKLLAFGIQQENLLGTMKILGDIASGANVPLGDLAQAFGKAAAKGKLMTEELNQFAERGVPIIDVLAKKMGVSKQKIFDLASKGKISFRILRSALQSMTDKGGIFFDQMAKQSRTLTGLFSTLRDNVNLALAEIGQQLVKTFDLKTKVSDAIKKIQEITARIKKFVELNPGLAKLIIKFIGITAVIGPLLVTLAVLIKSIAVINALLFANPIGLVVVGITALTAGVIFLIDKFGGLKKIMTDITDFFKNVWKSVVDAVTAQFRFIANVIQKIRSAIGIGGGQKNRIDLVNRTEGTTAATGARNVSESDSKVTVNIKDPGNNVSSIRSSTVGTTQFDVGKNMRGI